MIIIDKDIKVCTDNSRKYIDDCSRSFMYICDYLLKNNFVLNYLKKWPNIWRLIYEDK